MEHTSIVHEIKDFQFWVTCNNYCYEKNIYLHSKDESKMPTHS